ncbi:MAG: 50S ribosomal protein L9 [Lachnospiraceae bacterium]|nr:50S ribosomal protein L9 [Lachnospiraceae bacterium]
MEVILLEDVKSLGKKGEVVKINDGYARNFILKKKLGIEATAANINDLKLQNANNAKIAQEKLDNAKKLAEEIKELSVTVKIKTGAGGKTFGSVSGKEISQAAKEQLKLELDKKKFLLSEPIKSLGTHIIKIKLHPEVTAELTVKVVEE